MSPHDTIFAKEKKLYIPTTLSDQTICPIIIKAKTEARLAKTCFRATDSPLAGNFIHWRTAGEVFRNREVTDMFTEELSDVWKNKDFGLHGVTLELSQKIGWENTDKSENYSSNELEWFKPNRKSSAMRVKTSCTDILAPQTYDLTIIYQFMFFNEKPKVFIHSMYPGYDIGELSGNITKREKRIFFDWNHPGE